MKIIKHEEAQCEVIGLLLYYNNIRSELYILICTCKKMKF